MNLLPGFFDFARRLGYRRRWIATILAIQLGAVFFEGISVGMILPVLQAMNDSSAGVGNLDSGVWKYLSTLTATIGIPLNLATLLGIAFAAILVRQVFMYWREIYLASVQIELIRQVRNEGFQRFLYASFSYHDRIRAGDFVNELTTELRAGTGAMTSAATFLGYVLLCLGYLVIVISLSPALTLIATANFAFAGLFLIRLIRRIREYGSRVVRANQEMSSFFVEKLSSVRLVRLSGVEAAEQNALAARTLEQATGLMNLRKTLTLLGVLIEPIVVGISFVLLYFSITTVSLPFEHVLLFFFILLRLVPVVKECFLLRQSYMGALASIEVVDKRLTELGRFKDPKGGTRELNGLDHGIEFRDVTFHYMQVDGEPDTPAVQGIDLTVPAHKVTALVGPSGAGKSTLVDLLPRLREAQEGEILFDGVPQKEFAMVSLRHSISFAPQRAQIFNVSAAEHIRYGRPEATMEEVRQAARLAQAEDFIEKLPEGYETKLGESGERLSGGQRQRLDLARALVRGAPVLILDEPTSNLDANAESQFLAALERIRERTDTTIIIIAHRLSTIASADKIAIMEGGRVTDSGTHDQLINRNDWYRKAYQTQQLKGDVSLAAS